MSNILPPKPYITDNSPMGEDFTKLNSKLAKEIGLNDSIVLAKLNFWLSYENLPEENFKDGKWWYRKSMSEMLKDAFCFMSKPTLERTLKRLKEKKLIFATNEYNKSEHDKTNWYALNPEELAKLKSIDVQNFDPKPTQKNSKEIDNSLKENCVTGSETPNFENSKPDDPLPVLFTGGELKSPDAEQEDFERTTLHSRFEFCQPHGRPQTKHRIWKMTNSLAKWLNKPHIVSFEGNMVEVPAYNNLYENNEAFRAWFEDLLTIAWKNSVEKPNKSKFITMLKKPEHGEYGWLKWKKKNESLYTTSEAPSAAEDLFARTKS